jgi:hypothetical protein
MMRYRWRAMLGGGVRPHWVNRVGFVMSAVCPVYPGGLNRSTQHFILNGRDGVFGYVSKISSGFYCGREDGVMGSLAARGVFEGDWTSIWQAVIVYSSPSIAPRWDSSCATASLAVVIDPFGARGDIERPCGTSIGTIDGEIAGPLGLDGEPRTWPQWWL